MKTYKKPILTLFLFASFFFVALGQTTLDRFQQLELRLEEYATEHPKIDKQVDISVTGTIQEFAMAFSKETKINLTVDANIKEQVVSNFADTRPRDILLYLCKFYQLDLSFSGSIISLIPYDEPIKKPLVKEISVNYNDYNNQLELDLEKDTLDAVVKKISRLAGVNIIATKEASGEVVSGYIGKSSLDEALEQMARRNNLKFSKDVSGYYVFDLANTVVDDNQANVTNNQNGQNSRTGRRRNNRGNSNNSSGNLSLKSEQDTLNQVWLTLKATDVAIIDVIKQISEETNQSYFLFAEPDGKVTLDLEKVSYDQLLTHILQGTEYTFKKDKDIYLIGDKKLEGLRSTKVVQLQHRSVKDMLEIIPAALVENVQVQEFIELNSFILSGASFNIQEVESFIKNIDKKVPVITIELLIVDIQDTKSLNIGLDAGVANEPVTPGGQVFPGVDFTFSAKAINNLLGTLAGNGVVNLGQVNPNFYASLQFIEENGYAKVIQKPRLSTINGKEANLAIGETRYYLNERTTLQGNQNPISLQDRQFQAVNADFSIKILPVISGDEYVTLEIEVTQSDFVGQIQPNAPPPQVSRNFNSNIRVLDQDMIVLGGLESKGVEDSGSGIPFLARIPVIKWLFSKRTKTKRKSQLLIFVRPNIVY